MKVQWTQVAFRRLEEIYAYIEKDSPTNAARWVEKLLKKIEGVKDFPKAGRAVPELESVSVREIVYGNYRVIYKIGASTFCVGIVDFPSRNDWMAGRVFFPRNIGVPSEAS